jgi:hypothetical protein
MTLDLEKVGYPTPNNNAIKNATQTYQTKCPNVPPVEIETSIKAVLYWSEMASKQ